MITKVINKITTMLIENGAINIEDKEVYEYGIKHIVNILINIATTILIGGIFNMVWASLLFMLSYIPLRSNAGGYHTKTPLKCYIFSIILTVFVLISIRYISYNYILLLVLTIVSGIIIFIFAPVEAENKPLDNVEKRIFKKRTRIILFTEISLIYIFMIFNLLFITVCFVISMVVISFMIVLTIPYKIKRFNRYTNSKQKNRQADKYDILKKKGVSENEKVYHNNCGIRSSKKSSKNKSK